VSEATPSAVPAGAARCGGFRLWPRRPPCAAPGGFGRRFVAQADRVHPTNCL